MYKPYNNFFKERLSRLASEMNIGYVDIDIQKRKIILRKMEII